jgi:hypothetical protein
MLAIMVSTNTKIIANVNYIKDGHTKKANY